METSQLKKEIENALDIKITCLIENQLETYCRLLIKWSSKVNLCGQINDEIFWLKHVADSWLANRIIGEDSSVLDIGSGAGFPGIPLKIIKPRIKLTIIEKNYKKTLFLKSLIEKIRLADCEIINGKIDMFFRVDKNDYDIIIVRALKIEPDMEVVIRKMVRIGGRVILFNRRESFSGRVLEAAGWQADDEVDAVLPVLQHERKIAVFRNVSRETSVSGG